MALALSVRGSSKTEAAGASGHASKERHIKKVTHCPEGPQRPRGKQGGGLLGDVAQKGRIWTQEDALRGPLPLGSVVDDKQSVVSTPRAVCSGPITPVHSPLGPAPGPGSHSLPVCGYG